MLSFPPPPARSEHQPEVNNHYTPLSTLGEEHVNILRNPARPTRPGPGGCYHRSSRTGASHTAVAERHRRRRQVCLSGTLFSLVTASERRHRKPSASVCSAAWSAAKETTA